jgi:hypothetical protein
MRMSVPAAWSWIQDRTLAFMADSMSEAMTFMLIMIADFEVVRLPMAEAEGGEPAI